MKLFVNSIVAHNSRCNRANLSFVDVAGLPQATFNFNLFVPASVKLTAAEVNEVPYWVAKNIWQGPSVSYILKDLTKQAKASVHKRAEKAEAVEKMYAAYAAAEALNVEELPQESGEHFGAVGDTVIRTFSVVRRLKSWTNCHTGIWSHVQGFNGNYYWQHPTSEVSLWELTDAEQHTFILRCSNYSVNDQLSQALDEGRSFQMKATITSHGEFRGVKQTHLQVRKQELRWTSRTALSQPKRRTDSANSPGGRSVVVEWG